MSGFIVVAHLTGEPVERALIEGLTARLAHRGLDALGVRVDGGIGMGHALHRTTDEDQYGSQPGTLDGATWIVANARIDDRAGLIARLGLAGEMRPERTPDADLILHAYRKWGSDCPAQLLGDFAFVIWDGPQRRLFCARDRFGSRQLYYAQRGDRLIVSNALYCLLGHPALSPRLDDEAIAAFLLYGDHMWHDQGLTAFAEVRALPPAHRLVASGQRLETARYWDFPVAVPLRRYPSEGECVEHFRQIFAQAVGDRLRTDAAAVALSGGMDSTSIAATVRRIGASAQRPTRLTAVTVVYEQVHASEERRLAGLVAARLDLPIHFIEADHFPLLDPPIATTRPLELYNPAVWIAMHRKAAEQARVLFKGEAGDSLLHYSAGTGALREGGALRALGAFLRLAWRYRQPPGLGTGLLARWRRIRHGAPRAETPYPFPGWLNPDLEARLQLRQCWRDSWEQWARQPAPLNARHPGIHSGLTSPDWGVDDQYLRPAFILPEIRDPFLDPRLLDFILGLPPLPWLFSKHLLRLAMADELPEAIRRRPKTGLDAIHHSLLRRPDARWVDAWQPLPEVARYVAWSGIPPLSGTDADASYVNLRPLLLDQWLRALRETLAQPRPLPQSQLPEA